MSPVGITIPKLLSISGTWAAPFALYQLLLSSRVVCERMKTKHFIGDNIEAAPNFGISFLGLRSRAHANFLENVPLAFIFLGIAELNGGNHKVLHVIMVTLLAARIAHAEICLRIQGPYGDCGIGRPVGYLATQGVLVGLAGYAGYLVKGY